MKTAKPNTIMATAIALPRFISSATKVCSTSYTFVSN